MLSHANKAHLNDIDRFRVYYRLSPDLFDELHTLVAPRIEKMHTNWRKPICTEERLGICLR